MTEPASDLRLMRSLLEQRLRLAEENPWRESPEPYERIYNTGYRAALVVTLEELKAIEDRREKQRHD